MRGRREEHSENENEREGERVMGSRFVYNFIMMTLSLSLSLAHSRSIICSILLNNGMRWNHLKAYQLLHSNVHVYVKHTVVMPHICKAWESNLFYYPISSLTCLPASLIISSLSLISFNSSQNCAIQLIQACESLWTYSFACVPHFKEDPHFKGKMMT